MRRAYYVRTTIMDDQNKPTSEQAPQGGINPSQKKWIIIVIVVLVVLYLLQSFVFNPSRVTERMFERATNGEYEVSVDRDGTYNVSGKDGESVSVQSGGTTKVPSNWPDSVPIPGGATIEYAAVINGKANEAVSTVTYTSNESMESIANLYKDALDKNGWTVEGQIATGEGFVLSATRNEKETTAIYISTTNGKTSVTLSVQTVN